MRVCEVYSGVRVLGARFRVWGSGFRVQDSGARVYFSGCRVHGCGVRGVGGTESERHAEEVVVREVVEEDHSPDCS